MTPCHTLRPRLPALLLCLLGATLLGGCKDPAACASTQECFKGEQCIQQLCVVQPAQVADMTTSWQEDMGGADMREDVCARCGAQAGATASTCEDQACVITACATPYTLCETGCCAPALLPSMALPQAMAQHETSLARAPDGALLAAFYAPERGSVGIMESSGEGWEPVAYPVMTMQDIGRHASVSVDADGAPHLLYSNTSRGTLDYITRERGTWSQPVVVDEGQVGAHTASAFDARRVLHAAYYDRALQQLLHVSRAPDGTWSEPVILDASEQAGVGIALAIDSQDAVHVVYRDGKNTDLRYIRSLEAGGWSDSLKLEESGNVGIQPSLVIDSKDHLHVTSYCATDTSLHYIRFDGAQWSTPQPLTTQGGLGEHSALAVDSQDALHLVASARGPAELLYFKREQGSWSAAEVLAERADSGPSPQVVTDGFGRAQVIYLKDNMLRYASAP